MSLAGKVFKNNLTGDAIKVIDSFENIAILENKQKIDVKTLMDSNQYTEQIDPSSFFNNQGAYNILAEKIKNIPTHMIQDEEGSMSVKTTSDYDGFGEVSNESAIVMTTEEDEKVELARKYGVSMDNTNSLQKQNAAFAQILGDEAGELPQVPTRVFDEAPVERVEVQRDDISASVRREVVQETRVEDPIVTMFKRTKRNVEFKINIEVSDKIPRLDFIEMMEDSYEISMIDFLADEFTNKIIQDPTVIKNTIKDKIKQLVYGAPTTLSNKSNTKKEKENLENSETIQSVNDQITDAVTQVNEVKAEKTKTTRKPRAKKENS